MLPCSAVTHDATADLTRDVREVVAESVAYAVCSRFGLDLTLRSVDQCDGNPMPGVAFRAGRPYTDLFLTARTDEAGIVAFDIAGLPLNGTLRVIEELPSGTARFVAYCVDEAGAPLRIAYEDFPQNVPPIGVADVSVDHAGDVRCDLYTVPMP